VAYPTDSGLLAKAIRRIAATGRRIQAAGGALCTRCRDRSRSVGKRAHGIAAKLRLRGAAARDEAQSTVRRITGEFAGLAERAATEAQRLLTNARRALRRAQARAAKLAAIGRRDTAAGRRRGRLRRAVNDLTKLIEATRRIAGQTPQRVAGLTPEGATRRVSRHEPDARPIAKGRLEKPVEFGYKGQVLDNDDGVVLDHSVHQANPPMPRSWPAPSSGSSSAPIAGRTPSPPTAATARNALTIRCTTSGYAPSSSPARADRAKPARPPNTGPRSARP
jgi:IS5 family transposase